MKKKLDKSDLISITNQLKQVRRWAHCKIESGNEPPWAWFQYMKLIEVADAILEGMAATTTASSPQSDEHPETRLRLVETTCPQDTSRRRRAGAKVQMPM